MLIGTSKLKHKYDTPNTKYPSSRTIFVWNATTDKWWFFPDPPHDKRPEANTMNQEVKSDSKRTLSATIKGIISPSWPDGRVNGFFAGLYSVAFTGAGLFTIEKGYGDMWLFLFYPLALVTIIIYLVRKLLDPPEYDKWNRKK